MSIINKDKKAQYNKDGSRNYSGYWIVFFFLVSLWFASLFISQLSRDISWLALQFIIKDWQVFAAFITLVFFTICWTAFEGLSRFLYFLYLEHNESWTYFKHATRFTIITLTISTIICRYITVFQNFEDPFLWATSGFITILLSIIWFKGGIYKKQVLKNIEKRKQEMARPDYYDYFYIRFQTIILLAVLVGGALIFIWYHLSGTVPWITTFVNDVLPAIFTNPVIFTLFIILLCVTVFSPVFQFLSDYLPPLAGQRTLSYQTKTKIKKVRFWSLAFLGVVLIIKLIPEWSAPLWQKDLLSIAALILSWLVSLYRNKLLHSK